MASMVYVDLARDVERGAPKPVFEADLESGDEVQRRVNGAQGYATDDYRRALGPRWRF